MSENADARAAAPPARRPQMTRYLPAEVCILVETEARRGALPRLQAQGLYDGAMDWLNQHLQSILRRPSPRSYGSYFEQDMFPVTLSQRCSGSPAVLSRPKSNGGRQPWTELPGAGKLFCFFDVNPGDGAWSDSAGRQAVREMVNLINRRLLSQSFPERSAPASRHGRIVAATPHWLAAGTQSDFTDGGPAARPVPAVDGRWRFSFHNPALDELVSQPGPGAVVVAVLDTGPTARQVAAAAKRYPRNWLLQEVARPGGRFVVDEKLSVPRRILDHLAGYVPEWRRGRHPATGNDDGDAHAHDAYLMPDHGLFSASIIHQLAPTAEVHLIRTLSDYGVGDLMTLVDVLRRLPAALNPKGEKRLVVNLSLMAGVPVSGDFVGFWFPHSSADLSTVTNWQADIARTLDFAHRSLAETISWLANQGVLVVAAAGNDAPGNDTAQSDAFIGPARPEPRIPARYEDVLGVAAVLPRSDQPASYSNRGDVAVMGNGLAVFGGEAAPADSQDETESWVTTEGVVGLFSAPTLPLGGGRNTTGWAAWAGTSFATPIAAALAANVLTRDPSLRPTAVIERLRQYAQLSDDPLDREGPLDCPTIVASQLPGAPATGA